MPPLARRFNSSLRVVPGSPSATYRTPDAMVGEALAARQWAAQRTVTLTVSDTVGVLNQIAGNTDKSAWKDFTGVCNQLASSTGLAAAAALRLISS